MTRSELHMEKPKSKFMLVSIVLLGCLAAIFTALYFYSQSLITIEAPKKNWVRKSSSSFLPEKVYLHMKTL